MADLNHSTAIYTICIINSTPKSLGFSSRDDYEVRTIYACAHLKNYYCYRYTANSQVYNMK